MNIVEKYLERMTQVACELADGKKKGKFKLIDEHNEVCGLFLHIIKIVDQLPKLKYHIYMKKATYLFFTAIKYFDILLPEEEMTVFFNSEAWRNHESQANVFSEVNYLINP